MARIDRYLESLKLSGIAARDGHERIFTFTYGQNIVFKGKIKWNGNLEIRSFQGPDGLEETVEKINLVQSLRRKQYLDEETAIAFLEDFFENDLSSFKSALVQSKMNLVLNINSQSKIGASIIQRLRFISVVLPKSSRQEFIADIKSIVLEMKRENCSKMYIYFIVIIHFASVLYHALFFKLRGYFYTNIQKSKSE